MSQRWAVPSQHVRSIFEVELFVALRGTISKGWKPGEVQASWKAEMSKTNWGKQTQTGSVGVDLGSVSRFKTTVVTVITGCSLACYGSGWVRGWVLGIWVGKSLLWFLVDIHLSWLCQPPTFFHHRTMIEKTLWFMSQWDVILEWARQNLPCSHCFWIYSALLKVLTQFLFPPDIYIYFTIKKNKSCQHSEQTVTLNTPNLFNLTPLKEPNF